MLFLVGLGLYDEKDITFRGIDTAKNSDFVYAETYTSDWKGSFQKLEKMINKDIELLDRSGMEEDAGELIEQAKDNDVCIFIPGDPLVATTHSSLMVEAKDNDVPVKIVHASSIYSAIAETGLHIYKFGKTVSLPSSGLTESIIDGINENNERGLHTLVLCDIGLPFKDAIDLMKDEIEDEKVVILSQVGSENSKLQYDNVENLDMDIEPPYVIIIPGNLHFSEEDMLE